MTRADYEEFASTDTTVVLDQFPASIDVLTLHGFQDAVVPPYDAFIYAQIYGARSPGTHTLYYVEEADHNFTGVRVISAMQLCSTQFTRAIRFRKLW